LIRGFRLGKLRLAQPSFFKEDEINLFKKK
jgi:hypothetical protein